MSTPSSLIQPQELQQLLVDGCTLVDVREPVEHAHEHIANSILIPLGQLERQLDTIDRSQPIVVMCQAGKRGQSAMETLSAHGIAPVRNLDGGLTAWKQAGLPVVRGESSRLPLMQQVQLTIGLCVLTGAILSLTVHPYWVLLCAFFGAGLTMAGSTGWCGLAILMSKMPWNRVAHGSSCNADSCTTRH